MAQEIELKLSLPETEQGRFLRNPVLRNAAQRSTERLINIYYDTPDRALHCNGIALRLRQNRRRWLQTVKCAGISHAGLSSRPEWEAPYVGHFDFNAIDDFTTRKRLDRFKHRLCPVFETNFQRTAWKILDGGTELIVAFDRGTVVAAGKVFPISEVEIELVRGDIAAVFMLADRMAQHFALTPCLWSKAERGYRLFLGTPDRPARAPSIPIDSAMSPRAAFCSIALSCLNHLQQNHHGAMHSEDAEYIHQMRVALRRLRAALRLFRGVLPDKVDERLLPPLRNLMAALGSVRDLDVLAEEIVAPVVSALPLEPRITALASLVVERRHAARQQMISFLGRPEYGRLLLLVMAQLNGLTDNESGAAAATLTDFASKELQRLWRKTLRLARTMRQNDPASLHALRISAKRMRYTLECFTPVLPARRTAALLKRLTQLQNMLGQLNDLASAGMLLADCAGNEAELREAVSLVGGWHGQRYASLLAGLPNSLEKLHKLKLPKAG